MKERRMEKKRWKMLYNSSKILFPSVSFTLTYMNLCAFFAYISYFMLPKREIHRPAVSFGLRTLCAPTMHCLLWLDETQYLNVHICGFGQQSNRIRLRAIHFHGTFAILPFLSVAAFFLSLSLLLNGVCKKRCKHVPPWKEIKLPCSPYSKLQVAREPSSFGR